MVQNQFLIDKWSPALLLMELDSVLWKDTDTIAIKKLWEYLCTYCYLPRLAGYAVLEECIREGLNSAEYFAYAAGITEDRLIDLKYHQPCGIDPSGYLVRVDRARKQLVPEDASKSPAPPIDSEVNGDTVPIVMSPDTHGVTKEIPRLSTHFYMSATLDNTRINRDVQKLVEEVISQFASTPGAQLEVSLEVHVRSPEGILPKTVRDVSENCRTLKVKTFGFDE